MAIIFVPLRRLVGPTAKPPFSHARKCRPASLPPVGAARDGGVPTPVPVMLYSVVRCVPIAENAGDRSDRLDTSWAVRATAAPSAQSTIPHSAPRVCLAAAFPARRAVAESAAAVLTPPTLRYRLLRVLAWEPEKRLSLPLSLAFPTKQSTKHPQPFMRPVDRY
jgi:hypothetical protein